MLCMACEISDTNGMVNDSTEAVYDDIESLDSILALPLVGENVVNDDGYNDEGTTNESTETYKMQFGDSAMLGPEADQTLGESFKSFKTPFSNLIHRDLQQLYWKK